MLVYLTFFSLLLILAITVSIFRIVGLKIQDFIDNYNVENRIVNSFFSNHRFLFRAIASFCNEAQPAIPPKFGDVSRQIKFKGSYAFVAMGIFGITSVYLVFMLPVRIYRI